MAQHRTGQTAAAKGTLTRAVTITDQELAQTSTLVWNRKLTLELLQDEATALIGPVPKLPPAPPLPEPVPNPLQGRTDAG